MTNGAAANLETSASTLKKSGSKLFQMPLKSPTRVPNENLSNPNFGFNSINASVSMWPNMNYHQHALQQEPIFPNYHQHQEILPSSMNMKSLTSLESQDIRFPDHGQYQPGYKPGTLDSGRMNHPPLRNMSLPHQDWIHPTSTPSAGPANHGFWHPGISQSISPDAQFASMPPYGLHFKQPSPMSTFHLKPRQTASRLPYIAFL